MILEEKMRHWKWLLCVPLFALPTLQSAHAQCFGLEAGKLSYNGENDVTDISGLTPFQEAALRDGARQLNALIGTNVRLRWTSAKNAFATPNGEVIMGTDLVQEGLRNSGNERIGLDAAGFVLAHEFGHQWQFKNIGPDHFKSGPQTELQADMIGGYMLGLLVPRWQQATLNSFATACRSAFAVGDFDFNSPSHHGTPEERVKAVQAGLMAARDGTFGRSMAAWKLNGGAYNWSLSKIAALHKENSESEQKPERGTKTEKADSPSDSRKELLLRFIEEAKTDFEAIRGKQLSSEDGNTTYASKLKFPGAAKTQIIESDTKDLEVTVYSGDDQEEAAHQYDTLMKLMDAALPDYKPIATRPSRIALKKYHLKAKGEPSVSLSLLKLGEDHFEVVMTVLWIH